MAAMWRCAFQKLFVKVGGKGKGNGLTEACCGHTRGKRWSVRQVIYQERASELSYHIMSLTHLQYNAASYRSCGVVNRGRRRAKFTGGLRLSYRPNNSGYLPYQVPIIHGCGFCRSGFGVFADQPLDMGTAERAIRRRFVR